MSWRIADLCIAAILVGSCIAFALGVFG